MEQEAHKNPNKCYIAGVTIGILYISIGFFGATVDLIFTPLPQALIIAIAG